MLYIRTKQRRANLVRRIVIGIMIFSFASVFITSPAGSLKERPAILLIPLAILLFLACSPWLQRISLKKRLKVEGPMLKDVSVRVDDYGYHGFSGSGQGQMKWTAFDGFIEGTTVFALLHGFTFHPIPKRTLSATEREELESIPCEHLPRVGKPAAKQRAR